MKDEISKTEYLDFVEKKFSECFSQKGYIEEIPVDITSQVDPTVDFIGSKISPLKKYLVNEDFGNVGRYLIQPCMKLKSLEYLKTSIPQKFGCYYKCMGVLARPELEIIVHDTLNYFTSAEYLNLPFEDICIKISSTDVDLMKAISNTDSRIIRRVDESSMEHYRHRYGMDAENIFGRDFNIGIRKKGTDEYFSCATFVVMEKQDKKLAVDMGIGNCSLSMCNFGTNSTILSSRMADIIDIDTIEQEKFADALIAVATLLKENVANHSSKHFRKKFGQYVNALYYWNNKFQYTIDELTEFIVKYLTVEFHSNFEQKEEQFNKVLTLHRK